MNAIGLCRVSVRTDHDDPPVVVDLALPQRTELGALLPSIVDIVCRGGQTTDLADDAARRWQISRLGGRPLDHSRTLQESGVRDGDLLILNTEDTPGQVPKFDELGHAVAIASASANRAERSVEKLGAAACLWAAGVSAVVLGWLGAAASGHSVLIAGVVALTATAAVIIADRNHLEPVPCLTMSLIAVAFATVTGHLAVPGGPATPNLCLAAIAGSTVSIVLLRVTARGTVCLTAIAAYLAMVASAAAVAVVWPIQVLALSAGLIIVSLAALSVAAKLSIAMSGLSPAVPTADGAGDQEDTPLDAAPTSVIRGHKMLTGLLVGFSASAASGALLAAVASYRGETAPRVIALTAVVGTVLMLRARNQIDVVRITAVLGSGLLSVTATFALASFSAPRQVHWMCAIAVTLGVAVLCLTLVDMEARLSPIAQRCLELLEYGALVAVVPVACWVAGLFGLVRGLSLP
jgi:type VII secretion integral membrane protein EccD